jgi:hypothetical protein
LRVRITERLVSRVKGLTAIFHVLFYQPGSPDPPLAAGFTPKHGRGKTSLVAADR